MIDGYDDHCHHLLLAKKMILKYMANTYNYYYNTSNHTTKGEYIELYLK